MSLILVTHDLGVVAGHTDEIAVMYGGKHRREGTDRRRCSRDMKMPYTEALMQSIPKLDDPRHTRLRPIAGRPPDLVNPPAGCRFAPRCAYARDQLPRRGAAADRAPTTRATCSPAGTRSARPEYQSTRRAERRPTSTRAPSAPRDTRA